jgi:vacuolar-type H+-ATPase subunit E/Vma4
VAGLKSFFNLKSRVETTERDVRVLKEDHDKRLAGIESQIQAVRTEVRQDIKNVADQTEKRHDTLENLLRVVVAKVD